MTIYMLGQTDTFIAVKCVGREPALDEIGN